MAPQPRRTTRRTATEYLVQLRGLARAQGGVLLSRGYLGDATKLRWRCAVGHHFRKQGTVIRRGGWCPRCRGLERGDIGRMRHIARDRGGECLSGQYLNAETKLRWRCAEGHVWSAPPGMIVQGHWCPTCRYRIRHSLARLRIEDMRLTAAERGGECLFGHLRRLQDAPALALCPRAYVDGTSQPRAAGQLVPRMRLFRTRHSRRHASARPRARGPMPVAGMGQPRAPASLRVCAGSPLSRAGQCRQERRLVPAVHLARRAPRGLCSSISCQPREGKVNRARITSPAVTSSASASPLS